jgi:hypothetical protein
MKSSKSKSMVERKRQTAETQEIILPKAPSASYTRDKPLFHGHPEGNVEKLIEHGRQMGF